MTFSYITNTLRKSAVVTTMRFFWMNVPLFVWALGYYCVLYFTRSDLSYLVGSLCFFLLLYILLHDIRQAMFLMTVACLPFARGKSIDFVLIPKAQILFGLFDVGYYFPLYPSMLFLAGTIYFSLRGATCAVPTSRLRITAAAFCLFLFVCCVSMMYSPFSFVVALSVVQLLLLGGLYVAPYWLRLTKKTLYRISHILAAFTIVETGWILAQVIHGGPLGRYLEATLPLNRAGILSTEDAGFMRFNGTFYEPSIMGTFMLMHLFFFISFLLRRDYHTRLERDMYILAAISATISIIFSGSRGIYILLFCLGFYVFRTQIFHVVKNIANMKILRVFIYCIAIATLVLTPYFGTRLQTVPALFSDLFQGQGSGAYRVELDVLAYRLALVHPFGVGLNLAPYHFVVGFPQDRTVDPAEPHNIFFQLLGETGFVGVIVFSLFLWSIYRQYMTKHTVFGRPYFFASIIFLLCAQLYPMFVSQPEILSFFFLYAGLMNWTIERKKL